MSAITFHTPSADLASLIARVCEDHEPVVVNSDNQKPVVMMTLDEWTGWDETAYLLKEPANAAHLAESIAQFKAGNVVAKTMEELEIMESDS